jgi:Zn-finger nucleic acid-binding protein
LVVKAPKRREKLTSKVRIMARQNRSNVEVLCPCCGARLTVDAALGTVIAHSPPPKPRKVQDLDHAAKLLEKEAARREALFEQSAKEEKVKSQALERKFEKAMKKGKDEPPTPPIRDIDLD